jgi:hypothetical protein
MTKTIRNCVCLFGVLVGLAGGGTGAQESAHTPVAAPRNSSLPIRFEMRKVHREYGHDCRGGPKFDADACAWIDIVYPAIISAPSVAAKAKINQTIQQWVLEEFETGSTVRPVARNQEALFQNFIDGEERSRSTHAGWWFVREIEVEYDSPNVLSLSHSDSGYEGGAHENGRVDYANFRPSTGEPIRLNDIFKPGYEKPLNAIGEARFRALLNLEATASLRENGFWSDQFQLNDNFFIDDKAQESRLSDVVGVRGDGKVSWREQWGKSRPIPG